MTVQPTASARPARVAVYGSCVARDTVEAAAEGQMSIQVYVARQSLLSAGSDASGHFPADAPIDSAFQRRMMVSDFAGDLRTHLEAVAGDVDVLLWDLVDERHGVHEYPDGTVVTRSIDLVSVPEALAAVEDARHIPFGSDEHFSRWTERADAFIASLEEHALLARTVVLQVPWALITVAGEPTPWSMGVPAREANESYRRYYQHLRDHGLRILELQPLAVLADPEHRWGLAAFHYTPEVYQEIIRRLALEFEVPIPGIAPDTDPETSAA